MTPYAAFFLVGLLFAWISNELELIPWHRAMDAHWTEQARQLFPALIARQTNLWVLSAWLTFMALILFPDCSWKLSAGVNFLGVLLGNYSMDCALHPELNFKSWFHLVFSSLLLHLSGWTVFVIAAILMPAHWGWTITAIVAGFLAVHFTLQFGLSIRAMRWLRMLKPASPRLQSLVDETCSKMGVKVRATWEMAGAAANAMAFVTTRELAFTTKLLEVCTDDEIKAICAHELGHLTEGRWTLTGRILGTLTLLPFIIFRPVYAEWGHGGVGWLWAIVVIIWGFNKQLGKTMETRADKIAVETTAETTTYATALENIHRANRIPAVMRKSSGRVHPDLYDRMIAANLTPTYPKPVLPRRHTWTGYLGILTLVITVFYFFLNRN